MASVAQSTQPTDRMEVVHPRAQQMEPKLSEKETERAATGDSESSLEHLAGGVQLGVHLGREERES